VIIAIGATSDLLAVIDAADEIVDARGCVVTPGWSTRTITCSVADPCTTRRDQRSLFDWLKCLYPIWARYRPEDIFAATQLGLAELALSGCTLSSDHLYLFPTA